MEHNQNVIGQMKGKRKVWHEEYGGGAYCIHINTHANKQFHICVRVSVSTVCIVVTKKHFRLSMLSSIMEKRFWLYLD